MGSLLFSAVLWCGSVSTGHYLEKKDEDAEVFLSSVFKYISTPIVPCVGFFLGLPDMRQIHNFKIGEWSHEYISCPWQQWHSANWETVWLCKDNWKSSHQSSEQFWKRAFFCRQVGKPQKSQEAGEEGEGHHCLFLNHWTKAVCCCLYSPKILWGATEILLPLKGEPCDRDLYWAARPLPDQSHREVSAQHWKLALWASLVPVHFQMSSEWCLHLGLSISFPEQL